MIKTLNVVLLIFLLEYIKRIFLNFNFYEKILIQYIQQTLTIISGIAILRNKWWSSIRLKDLQRGKPIATEINPVI